MVERLNGLGAFFLYVETPTSPMHVGSVLVLDPGTAPGGRLTRDEVAGFLEHRLHLAPALRRRLVTVPFHLDHPVWVDDAGVDLDEHVRSADLPPPGGWVGLARLTARLMSRRLDRSRPLWDVHVVPGPERGRVALIARSHHAATDGVAGVALANALLAPHDGEGLSGEPMPAAPGDREPGRAGLLLRAGARMAGRSVLALRTAPHLAHTLAGAVPLTGRPAEGPDGSRSGLFGAPAQPWNGALGRRRVVAFARLPLASVDTVRQRLGGSTPTGALTVNDVLLAAVAGALRDFLEHRGAPLETPVTAMVPVALADGGSANTPNRISATVVTLPVGEADPVARLGAVSARMATAKSRSAAGGPGTVPRLAELLPAAAIPPAARLYGLLRIANHHRPVWNTVVSNVPGPRERLSVAGAAVESIYPLGPVHEMNGLNVTLLSYAGDVFVGLNADRRLLPDVGRIADAIPAVLAQLVDARPGRA